MLSLEYIAGFFDGEGSVSIRAVQSGGPFSLNVAISQTSEDVLYELRDRFGGSVHYQDRHKRPIRSNGSPGLPIWQWVVCGRKAAAFLKSTLPHLVIKAAQAEVGIKFQDAKGFHKDHSPKDMKAMTGLKTLLGEIREAVF